MHDEESEHCKEVYARFGLAVYHAQVLEHGIVNALVVLDLIPSRRHLMRSRAEWENTVDSFMDGHFETTMGRLIACLRSVSGVPTDLEELLRDALKRRNWLAHDFFRERSAEFMSFGGREQMIAEVEECRACFQAADLRIEEIVKPLREAAGITEEMQAKLYEEFERESRREK